MNFTTEAQSTQRFIMLFGSQILLQGSGDSSHYQTCL
jgi:hypothetical protein